MNKTNAPIASTKGTSTLVKSIFGPGMVLQAEDLQQLNSYTRDLSRLLFKSFFGCGVVCGLVVKVDPKCGKVCLTVGAGLALACSGDPVYVPKDQTLALDENCDSNVAGPLWVVLCGTVKQCAPRTAMCASDDDEAPSEPTRERDMFEIRVVSGREPPQCVCGCPEPSDAPSSATSRSQDVLRPTNQQGEEDHCLCADPACHADHYAGKCGCNCDECSDDDCKCILLAKLIKNDDKEHPWRVDHRVRRFIRPVLMRDPQVESEEQSRYSTEETANNKLTVTHAFEEVRVTSSDVAVAAQTVGELTALSKNAAEAYAEQLAATNEVNGRFMEAKVVADEARKKAHRAKGAAKNARKAEDKDAAEKDAAEYDLLAEELQAEADKFATLAKSANAELEKLAVEASEREGARLKAIENKVAKDLAVAAATDKLAALVKG